MSTKGKFTEEIKKAKNTKFSDNKPLIMMKVKEENGNVFKIESAYLKVQQISDDLKKSGKNGTIWVSYKSKFGGWVSTSKFDIGTKYISKVNFYDVDLYDDETIEEFVVYIKASSTKGGCTSNKNNDCLYYCLKDVLGDDLSDSYRSAAHLKSLLGIDRADKIDYTRIPEIERRINTVNKENNTHRNVCINVTGDVSYASTSTGTFKIDIILSGGHYTLKQNDTKRGLLKVVQYFTKVKKFVVYYKKEDGNYLLTFDGENELCYDKTQFDEIQKKEYHKLSTKEADITHEYSKIDVLNIYNRYIQIIDQLKKKSMGAIDLYKTGTFKCTALRMFDDYNKQRETDMIDENEARFLELATSGAVMWCEKGYEGKAYEYDINSFYPSLLRSQYFMIPTKRPNFCKLDELPQYVVYGVYHCIITISDISSKSVKFFKFNKNNYYTHIDIKLAQSLNMSIQLVTDDDIPNAMIYEKEGLIKSSVLFARYADDLYDMKKEGVLGAKLLLNILWGALTESNLIIYRNNKEIILNTNDTDIKFIHPDKNNEHDVFKCTKKMNMFYTNYGRMKPFLLARGRYVIINEMDKYVDNVIRVHTDGFYSKKELDIKTSYDIGDFKHNATEDVYEHIKIENINKIVNLEDVEDSECSDVDESDDE